MEGRTLMWTQGDPYLPAPTGEEEDEAHEAPRPARVKRLPRIALLLALGGAIVALVRRATAGDPDGRPQVRGGAPWLGGSKASLAADAAPLPPARGLIRHSGGLCLDFRSLAVGEEARIEDCQGPLLSPLQSWVYDAGTASIRTANGICLDGGGERLHLWDCDAGIPSQRWKLTAGGALIVHEASKRCLAARDGIAVLNTCDAGRVWTTQEASGLRQIRFDSGEGACLHADSGSGQPEKYNLAVVRSCVVARRWIYEEAKRQVRHHSGDLCLRPDDPSAAGSQVRLARCDPRDALQRFAYFDSGQLSTVAGFCLDTSQPRQVGGEVHLWACSSSNPHQVWNLTDFWAQAGAAPASFVSPAPAVEFYVYRAMRAGETDRYPFGDMNAGNMDGVMWYLMNEVVTEYTARMACPRKFQVHEIRRFRVRMRPTQEMVSQGHHFGARFAYDRGQCVGRCFPGNKCTCKQDCDAQFERSGHVVGCNNFRDHYPFPDTDTQAPDGVWFSFPLGGKCDYPTGSHSCTYSAEETGVISLAELENVAPGKDQCCDGLCTDFWVNLFDVEKTRWRVQQALDVFQRKYPDSPRELDTVPCDFRREAWYSDDDFARLDPWDKTEGCMKERFQDDVQPMYAP